MFGNILSHRIRLAILILLLLMVSACSAIQPRSTDIDTTLTQASASSATITAVPSATAASPIPSATAASPSNTASPSTASASQSAANPAQIKASIQESLDLYARAYNENDGELLKQVADQTNAPFRRLIQTRFDTYQESIFGGQGGFSYEVGEIKPREHGFVEAKVYLADDYVNNWTFREVNGKWLMSEPTEKQIGKKEKIETEHFTFITYPWAAEVNPVVIELMEKARQRVIEKLGKDPNHKADVLIKPIFGIGPPISPTTLAYYVETGSARGADRIVVAAPHSYVFQFYDEQTGWEQQLETVLTHEYTHLVNERAFTPIARMSDWMYEGLAEYVADDPRPGEVATAVRSGNIIPIVDTSDRLAKQDLQHFTALERDVSLGYGLSYELVAYINEQYGGMDGFWKLVEAYDKSQKLDKALQQAFGIGYEQFDREWRDWLSQKYGG